ncbi:hypothetical protein J5X84_25795 [Streptosporangiaceae bacterium NEAU-GS5]|nr:hypothetical protein [Streptosporangiaceae bacterium NEAU-GS5]
MKVLTAALRRAVRLLPPDRRGWGSALLAEAASVPEGWPRVRWLLGGLRMIAGQALVGWTARLLRAAGAEPPGAVQVGGSLIALATGGLLVWLDWHPGSENVAAPVNRASMVAVVALLAAAPWIARPLLGPVAPNRTARLVRIGGYLTVYGVLAVVVAVSRFAGSRFDHFKAFDQANHDAEVRSQAIAGVVIVLMLFGGYATAILTMTSRRLAPPPATLARATVFGVLCALACYSLMPLGNPLQLGNPWLQAVYVLALILVPAGLLAAGARGGIVAGLWTGLTAAPLTAVLTVTTMLFLPRHVDLIWANPSPFVPHGTPYEIQMTMGDTAGKYQIGLFLGPIAGLLVGAFRSATSKTVADVAPLVGGKSQIPGHNSSI